jgi:mannosyltransferase OCH1-like enzyme
MIDEVILETKQFIDNHLMGIINNTNEGLEGNLFMYHLNKTYYDEFTIKQRNIVNICKNLNSDSEINVLEIGFNSGFSAVLLLLSNPNIILTCVDIGEHKYTLPCFHKIKEHFPNRINLLINDSTKELPFINNYFDLIHIDGAHSEKIATDDIINSYHLSKHNTILIFDDYDIPTLKEVWDKHSKIFNLQDIPNNEYENIYQGCKKVTKDIIFQPLFNVDTTQTVPKIIHKIAPLDRTKWPEKWVECQQSWFEKFPESEYTYMLWNDESDLDNFIKDNFPSYYDSFITYKYKIQKIDIFRYFVLIKYGGIYADMDYYCVKNFYNDLNLYKTHLTESPHVNNEYLQNSLMVAPKNSLIYYHIIDEAFRRKELPENFLYPKLHGIDMMNIVVFTTGPKLLSDVYDRKKSSVVVLQKELYNPANFDINNDNIYTAHYGTGTWV